MLARAFSGETTSKTSPAASKRSRLERATGSASSSRPSDSRFHATIKSCTPSSQPWPAGSSRSRLAWYMPGIATQAAVTVHRSAGLLRPGTPLVVLAAYAAVALGAAAMQVAHRDA
jgi:hypothetical protein